MKWKEDTSGNWQYGAGGLTAFVWQIPGGDKFTALVDGVILPGVDTLEEAQAWAEKQYARGRD